MNNLLSPEVRLIEGASLVMTLRAMFVDLERSGAAANLGVRNDNQEEAAEWLLKEGFQRGMNIRVAGHYRHDEYKCLYDLLGSRIDNWWSINGRQIPTYPGTLPIQYVKLMLVGTVIIIGVFRNELGL